MKTKGGIVRAWREARGWSPRELGDRVGTSRQNIENLEADAVDQPRYLPTLAKVMGYATVEELLALKEPPAALDSQGNYVTIASGSLKVSEPQAQSLSYPQLRIPQKPMSWGELKMLAELPDLFEVVLDDDAMAPEFPAGTVIKFRRGDSAKFGDRVLLRDGKRGLHLREYTQALDAAGWFGKATGRGFADVLPGEHGAAVVAVKIGHYVEGS